MFDAAVLIDASGPFALWPPQAAKFVDNPTAFLAKVRAETLEQVRAWLRARARVPAVQI